MAKQKPSDNNSTANTGEENPQPAHNAPVSAVVPEPATTTPAAPDTAVQGNSNETAKGVTKQDLKENPETIDLTLDAVDEAGNSKAEATANELKKSETPEVKTEVDFTEEIIAELMAPYLEHYPNEKTFYITSDFNVFLSGGKVDAETHQRTIAKGVEMVVFTVS